MSASSFESTAASVGVVPADATAKRGFRLRVRVGIPLVTSERGRNRSMYIGGGVLALIIIILLLIWLF
jgi:hypothetical protein